MAKIYTIFKAPRKFFKYTAKDINQETFKSDPFFKDSLEEYNIGSFLNSDTEIEFDSELHYIKYSQGNILYNPKVLNKIRNIEKLAQKFDVNREKLKTEILELSYNFIFFAIRVHDLLDGDSEQHFSISKIGNLEKFRSLDEKTLDDIIGIIKKSEESLSTNTALYIPAERNFINIIKNASLNLQRNNVPIPMHILSFGAELEKSKVEEIDLSFLHENIMYKSVNGEDRIFTDSDHSIKLSDAASGIQSAVPILIPILHERSLPSHRSFVIEEPELNLFPLAQYELIKKLESYRRESFWEDYGTIHTYTTHSPYILSAINNLLYAHKVGLSVMVKGSRDSNRREEAAKLVKNIVSAEINPSYFTAYQISDGTAEPILDRDTGLIRENYIDDASDKISDDFEALTDLLNEKDPF